MRTRARPGGPALVAGIVLALVLVLLSTAPSKAASAMPASDGYGELRAQNSGQDVAVAGSSTAAGTPDIVQQAPGTAANGLWLPLRQSDGSYAFQNRNSSLCLDVYGGGSNSGQQLDQWQCKNAPGTNQDFVVRSCRTLRPEKGT